ncbi:hypothetical protein P1J78_20800 [Psychromarinibacter sp. C21-152]|uniref:Uncharacterized protein n=1 Tax=Psychromarinibacter sediminicola TaxID=3033385 RepID=A0AAE3TAT5_9RHOB|nr:hypothetical protein [Psychromarinibacter sediminicola]MDF0603188.1 hypothetical protein [Psychromarinibacter sediminicola]
MPLRILLALCLAAPALPAAADSVAYRFEWPGAGGYAMRGALSFDAALMGTQRVLETDVQCFVIEGYHQEERIGRWALGMKDEETTWRLTFDPVLEEFVVWGPQAPMPQAWNMDGGGYDCGPEGFGFNIGNAAQDLCVNGDLIEQSQVDPARAFPAERDDDYPFPADACRAEMLMSRLR